jgi:hypothetical protein
MKKTVCLHVVLSVLVALAAAGAPSPAGAQGPSQIGGLPANAKWLAFEFMEEGNKVCYMAGRPDKAEGNYSRRGDIFLLVTHRPSEGARDVVSVLAGYPYKPDTHPTITIDDEDYQLTAMGETAWAENADTDSQLVRAMRAGSQMVVRGTSTRGTETTDTYSLIGFTAAHNAITSACGL